MDIKRNGSQGKAVEWMEKVTDEEYLADKSRDRSQ